MLPSSLLKVSPELRHRNAHRDDVQQQLLLLEIADQRDDGARTVWASFSDLACL